FFTDEELASSGGVLWDAAADGPPTAEPRLALTPHASAKRAFTAKELAAWGGGDAFTCFGEGFERAGPHHRTPRPPSGRLKLLDAVTAFEPQGGPWGRGYLRAEAVVPSDAWFYDGHFHNDPCMPGTLMADAATQALSAFMAASGLARDRDGWRFEPAEGEAFKFVCRGQVVPGAARRLSYEVFVDEIIDGPEPTVFASLLATCDGLKVFHCPRFGLKLVRDWPRPPDVGEAARIVSPAGDVRGDEAALLACANGRPTDAFGSMYARFDRESRIPRLPTAPYHFVSRIVSVSAPPGAPAKNAEVVAEYDPPGDAWFFAERGGGAMPFAVLAEVMLQPCGWLASYAGFALAGDLAFRNLDGDDMTLARPIRPGEGPVRVTARLTRWSAMGAMTLVFFDVRGEIAGETVATVRTSFGFFPEAALAQQKGLPFPPERRALRQAPSPVHERLPACRDEAGARLNLVDEVTGLWPVAGEAGLGRIRGRQRVDPRAWCFRAHFYEDPVQAGSLGLEAL
ncbi:MAG: hypothetical protein MI723_14860, partial [Caulobacterales bacterium]|nr:hypothetical protein [Caulobacterales bacterium]